MRPPGETSLPEIDDLAELCFRSAKPHDMVSNAAEFGHRRAVYQSEALEGDTLSLFRVLHKPYVAVRKSPSLDADAAGLRKAGEIVAACERRGNWIRLAHIRNEEHDPLQLWMLVDGVGTSVAHLGTLLEPVPKGSVVPTSLANGGAYFVPARLAPQTCASTRFLGGVAGGCDADGSWRVFLNRAESKTGEAPMPSFSNEELLDARNAMRAPSMLLVLPIGGEATLRGTSDGDAASMQLPLAHAACELCRDGRAILVPSAQTLHAVEAAKDAEWLRAEPMMLDSMLADEAASLPPTLLRPEAARRVVVSAADTMAAEALSFAAAYAVYRPESTGAWLRLHTPPKPSATHEDMGDDEEWEKRPHLDAPDPWDDSKWKEARTAAAASGVSVLVSGGAHARRVANWLRDGGVRNICFCSKAGTRAAERGVKHEEWTKRYKGCGVDRPVLWIALKWALAWLRAAETRSNFLLSNILSSSRHITNFRCTTHGEAVIAVGQLQPRPGRGDDWISGGEAALNETAANAKAQGASLLVAPECFLQGYEVLFYARDEAAVTREEAVRRVGAIARRHSIGIVCGYAERPGEEEEAATPRRRRTMKRVYNSAVLIDPSGTLVLHHRKVHITDDERVAGISAADDAENEERLHSYLEANGMHTQQFNPELASSLEAFGSLHGPIDHEAPATEPPTSSSAASAAAIDVSDSRKEDSVYAPCTLPLPWLGGRRVGILICADLEVLDVADRSVAAGADLLLCIACAYIPEYKDNVSARRNLLAWQQHEAEERRRLANEALGGGGNNGFSASIGPPPQDAESPAWLAASSHAARLGVFMVYCNQAKGLAKHLAEGTMQGGSSRVIAPCGRDVAAVDENAHGALLVASLGTTARQRLGWSGTRLHQTLQSLI